MTKRNLIWVGVLVLVAVAVVLLTRQPAPPAGEGDRPQFSPVVESYRLVKENGYGPSDDDRLIRGAVGGMAGAADEHSTYVPPERVESFRRRIEGKDCGVGLSFETSEGLLKILEVVFDSPAYQAGLEPGQAILAIGSTETDDISPPQAERLINEGSPGSSVTLSVAGRDGQARTVKLERQSFKVESVVGLARDAHGRWRYLVRRQPPIALVRIREFVRDTAEDVQAALRQVDSLEGLILDLRDNPGGQLPSAVAVADLFLGEGPILTMVDRDGAGRPRLARLEDTYGQGLRIAVLVDGRTASAAEIVAGALAANRRAVLIGTRTKGKGQVQSSLLLPAGMGEVNLTTGEFLLGNGESITRRAGSTTWGVEPHVRLEVPLVQRVRLRHLWSRLGMPQAVDADPLSRPSSRVAGTGASTSPTASAPVPLPEMILEADRQLAKAIELLSDAADYEAILRPHAGVATSPESQDHAR